MALNQNCGDLITKALDPNPDKRPVIKFFLDEMEFRARKQSSTTATVPTQAMPPSPASPSPMPQIHNSMDTRPPIAQNVSPLSSTPPRAPMPQNYAPMDTRPQAGPMNLMHSVTPPPPSMIKSQPYVMDARPQMPPNVPVSMPLNLDPTRGTLTSAPFAPPQPLQYPYKSSNLFPTPPSAHF